MHVSAVEFERNHASSDSVAGNSWPPDAYKGMGMRFLAELAVLAFVAVAIVAVCAYFGAPNWVAYGACLVVGLASLGMRRTTTGHTD
jgi:hypothetical protein